MSYIKVTEEQLSLFAKSLYEEACCGYMDLKDSICSKMLKEFIADKKTEPEVAQPNNSNIWAGATISTNVGGVANFTDVPNWNLNIYSDSALAANGTQVRLEEFVRPESFVRTETI